MKIVTFYDLDSSLFEKSFSVEPFSNTSSDADVVIIGIDTIFDFEENKAKVCKDNFASIAVIEDESEKSDLPENLKGKICKTIF